MEGLFLYEKEKTATSRGSSRLGFGLVRPRLRTGGEVSSLSAESGGAVDDAGADEEGHEAEHHHPIRRVLPNRSKCHDCTSREDEYCAKDCNTPSL